MSEIMDGMLRVEGAKDSILDPAGKFLACKNALGTWVCERCGQDVRTARGACPAIPVDLRWRMSTRSTFSADIPYRDIFHAPPGALEDLPLVACACMLVAFLCGEGARVHMLIGRDPFRQMICLEITVESQA